MIYYVVVVMGVLWAILSFTAGLTAFGNIKSGKAAALALAFFMAATAVVLFSYAEVLRG